ncbi:MAG: response regulator transcription factor [Phycisphaeraceae bacterium]|nr:response regulator transcription factor [Phycisphaeraceae bacterium]
MRVLIIEDNPKIAAAITHGLREQGMAADTCAKGFEGEELAASNPYDAIILDLMLPDRDGVEVCKNLRRRKIATPLLMLTALATTQDKVNGLEAGADDYMSKPFEFDELVARLRTMARRGQASEGRNLRFHDLELDLDRRVAIRENRRIRLSNKEFSLLYHFLQHPERVLSRTQIIGKVWDMNYEPESNVVDVYVSALRKKIDRDFSVPLLQTVIGGGYRLGLPDEVAASSQADTSTA